VNLINRTRTAEWRPPISFLPRPLREPRRPVLALAVAWATAFLPSLPLGAAVSSILPRHALPVFPTVDWYVFFLIVVAAPLFETMIMGAALLLLRLFLSPTQAVLVSAVGWGILHSTAAPAWGLVIWWPFLIFSTVFLTWRSRSVLAAVAMAAATHTLHNLLPALLLVFGLQV
jgi:membrane protease YdiL (CAAX protease family)